MPSQPDTRDPSFALPPAAHALDALDQELRQAELPDLDTRIHLVELLLAAGRQDEAVHALLKLADELMAAGLLARAFGLVKRAEALRPDDPRVGERLALLVLEQQRLFAEVSERLEAAGTAPGAVLAAEDAPGPATQAAPRPLAPLAEVVTEIESLLERHGPAPDVPAAGTSPAAPSGLPAVAPPPTLLRARVTEPGLLDLVEETLRRPLPTTRPPSETLGHRLLAAPLFAELTRQELADVIRRLRLRAYRPGDVLVTEGESGRNLSILTSGQVKVFVRSPTGRDVQVARLEEGDFFGEVSAISGSRRTATIVAATPCESLELTHEDLDALARAHPHVRDRLDQAFVERAGSQAAAVVRAIDITAQGHVREQADLALASRFGRSWWDPRMRLRLASALIRAGHEDEALPILAEAAGVLLRAGRTSAATLLLRKIEGFHFRDVVEIHLAPLRRALGSMATAAEGAPDARPADPVFQQWLIRAACETLARPGAEGTEPGAEGERARALTNYGPGLRASPLFESLTDEELLALLRDLRLVKVEAGDIVLTQGEQGESLFVLVSGAVKIWVRNAGGRNVSVCRLEEGAFFGEIATLSGRPRSATVTAAEHCALLEVNRENVAAIRARHPHVGVVLEAQFLSRSAPA